jgi:hypothetical protein
VNFYRYLRAQWDRALAVTFAVAGAVVLLLGYLGTRDAVLVEEQIPYVVSGGFVGIFLLALGAVLWISADLRDDWRELRGLKQQVARLAEAEEWRERAGADRASVAALRAAEPAGPIAERRLTAGARREG